MNLAFNYPILFWNCACLIVDSGGTEDEELEELQWVEEDLYADEGFEDFAAEPEEDEEDDEEEEQSSSKSQKKKKQKKINYGRIATAIGKMKSEGVDVAPPSVNNSTYTFSPDVENNLIRYGLSGISKVGEEIVKNILAARPFSSIDDFRQKVKVNKTQMINLIKSGAFDEFGDRMEIMKQFIISISEPKKRVTLQNMKMLIDFNLIPDELAFERKVFNFNKYLKKHKVGSDYLVDEIAYRFYEENFNVDLLKITEKGTYINQSTWDNIYKKKMDTVRAYIKANHDVLLQKMNDHLISDVWNKYCLGTISKWEMDSVSYYSHDHELNNINLEDYDCVDFFKLDETPEIEGYFYIKGKKIPRFKINRIMGTVLDKDKNKKTVTLLTTTGVVTVKIYGQVFSNYDKQISERGADGKKHVIEKSMFTRGNKIIICGIKTGEQEFLAKKYSATPYHLVEKIVKVNEKGLIIQKERADGSCQ